MPPRKPASTPDPSPPRRKRRWKRRLLIAGLLLLILGALANGPGARWLIHRTIRSELAKISMEGDLLVAGSLLTGFSLLDGNFSDPASEAAIKFDELAIQYEFLELLQKKLRLIEGRNLKIVLLGVEKADEKTSLPDFNAIGEQLRTYRELARPISIDIEQVHYRLQRPDKTPIDYHLGALTHPANTDVYSITGFQSNTLGETGLPTQDLRISWKSEDIQISQLTLFPDLSLRTVQVNYTSGSPVELFASVSALSSQLIAYADSTGKLEIDLKNDPLDLATTAARFIPDLNLSGEVSLLHLKANGLLGEPDQWDLVANLDASNLEWEGKQLDSISADLILDERAHLITDFGDGIKLRGDLENPLRKNALKDNPNWWKGIAGTAELEFNSIHEAMRKRCAISNKPLPDFSKIPEGILKLNAELITSGPLSVEIKKADWSILSPSIDQRPLPDLKGTASLIDTTANLVLTLANPREKESLTLATTFRVLTQNYEASLDANLPDPEWLKPLIPSESPDWKPTGPLALTWKGKGSLDDNTHEGQAEISELTLTSPGEPGTTAAALTVNYDWPRSLNIPSLSIHNGDLWIDGSAQWSERRLSIPILRLHDDTGQLASIKGSLPFSPANKTLEQIFDEAGPVDLAISADDLKLERLQKLVPLNLPTDLTATLHGTLSLGGRFSRPSLNGNLQANSVHLPSAEKLPLLDAQLNFETKERTLQATGSIMEPGGEVLTCSGKLPLNIREWIQDPASFQDLTLDASAKVNQLALSRLQVLEPSLAAVEGSLSADFKLSGTISEPNYTGTANATMKRYPLPVATFREIRDASLNLKLEDDRIVIQPSSATVAGGVFTLSGEISRAEEEPTLALRLKADQALVWRNDSFILRSSGDLKLVGPLSAAHLSGSLNLVESLFYKDIEIIPIGVPTANAPKPKLPKIDEAKVARAFGIPAPYSDWTLDLSLKTEDPILIRGNVAKGEITADTRIGGTLSSPRPSGKFRIEEATADLPFSTLQINNGSVILQPDAPLDPILDIRGTSTVDNQRVNLYLYGSLSQPKYNLSSDRGLAENEVLTLLATGTSAADLEDPEVAKSKAFQAFIDGLRRRANKPGGNRYFREVLNELDDVNLKVGENDPFSGRKFNSATLQVADRWHLSAAVDGQGNSRGLVIFSMRFK